MSIKTKNHQALHWKHSVGGISTVDGVITEWPDSLPTLTQTLVNEIEAEYEEKEAYKEKRRLEYPPLEECIHALLDDQHLIELQAKRKLVKEKYPK